MYKTCVIVPTFRRPDDLLRCVAAVAAQVALPAELIVVVRRGDQATADLLAGSTGPIATLRKQGVLRTVEVDVPGVIAAMQAGLDNVSAEIEVIALTDDDAAPRPQWLLQIDERLRTDSVIAGVGGRDWQWSNGKLNDAQQPVVGKVQWFGRMIGNHHLGIGGPRDVDILKGANCAFRAPLLREIGFDRRLRGLGAQVHWEVSLCLQIRRKGWRLTYDPAVAVDHYPAPRADADSNNRGGFHGPSQTDAVHNETLALLDNLSPARRLAFVMWFTLLGARTSPGLGHLVLNTLCSQPNALSRFNATVAGRVKGWQSYCRAKAGRKATVLNKNEAGLSKDTALSIKAGR